MSNNDRNSFFWISFALTAINVGASNNNTTYWATAAKSTKIPDIQSYPSFESMLFTGANTSPLTVQQFLKYRNPFICEAKQRIGTARLACH